MPTPTSPTIGWIGTGRMGYEMAARLAKGGADVLVWNRTRAKAEPLAQYGAKIADRLGELAARDVVFCMVATWKDVKQVMHDLLAGEAQPRVVIECSSISLEGSAELREELLKLRREQFNLRMAQASGASARPDQFGKVRRNVARVKTVLGEKARAAANKGEQR